MLVLSRKLNQSVCIGDSINIRVVRIKGNVVQLGIEAPKAIHVVRSELLERDAKQQSQPDQANARTDGLAPARDDSPEQSNSDIDRELIAALRVISESTPARSNQQKSDRVTNLSIVI